MNSLKDVCKPAVIYFWIMIVMYTFNAMSNKKIDELIWGIVVSTLTALGLNLLCKYNHIIIAWIVGMILLIMSYYTSGLDMAKKYVKDNNINEKFKFKLSW